MNIGYARVSTTGQNIAMQIDALESAGCERIYRETASGIRTDRPELVRMLDALRPGDTVTVWKLDRLGRSTRHLVETVEILHSKGVQFRSLTEGIDTTTAGGMLVFTVFAGMAQFERDLIRERTQEGLAAARRRGHKAGRPTALTEKDADELRRLHASHQLSVAQLCELFGISRTTAYRTINRRNHA